MTIPLLRFLHTQLENVWARRALTLTMAMLVISAIGCHSRGALLAIIATTGLLWWRDTGNRLRNAVLIAGFAMLALSFASERWFERMETIENYESDTSSMGWISAWWTAFNLAKERPLGVGFNPARPDIFALYSPYRDMVQGAHSIYFQILGKNGFIGLLLWLTMWFLTWRPAGCLRKHSGSIPEARWAAQFGAMAQVSMLAHFVVGAFLSLAYFDLPYYVMAAVLLARVWVQKKAWLTEPALLSRRWLRVPGPSNPKPPAPA